MASRTRLSMAREPVAFMAREPYPLLDTSNSKLDTDTL